MKNIGSESQEVHDFQKGYLALPFNEEQFQSFIKSLLGTPQTITKRIKGSFEIHLKDLQNFHDLINQRITQQNNGKLIQLKTQVYYSDESSVLLSSYEELVSYNEIKPVVSEAVRMTWVYLIQFADKSVPEKQEIELMIIATPQRNVIEDDDIPIFIIGSGQLRIVIKHTARTWGADIEALITNQVNSILLPCSKLRGFLNKNNTQIGLLTGILFLISSLLTVLLSTKSFNNNEMSTVSRFLINTKNFEKKVDYLISYIARNDQSIFSLKSQLYILISIFVAVVVGVVVASFAENRMKSYLVLTREAKKKRDELVEKSKNKTILFWVSIALSVLTGIIANYIFTWLTAK